MDHFEPANGDVTIETQANRIKAWVECYPKMANKHRDADGITPQHTWFYPPHHDLRFLAQLTDLCKRGYGEIELHLHHNRMKPFPDTSETLRTKIMKCIEDYSQHGIFCLPDGSRRFAFIHGDWSLDNSRGSEFCGINNELHILKECGCYADFTFPSLGKAQPAIINKIYYAKDNPHKPKSYAWGKDVLVGKQNDGDFMMIPGIIGIRFSSYIHMFKPCIESSNLDFGDEPSPERVEYWIKNAISIYGKPEWKFIKLHTHGARETTWDSLFGKTADTMFSYLEDKYNDSKKYTLHYVTARQMYNIIKAAESGKDGNPDNYRNYLIKQYVYSAR